MYEYVCAIFSAPFVTESTIISSYLKGKSILRRGFSGVSETIVLYVLRSNNFTRMPTHALAVYIGVFSSLDEVLHSI